IRAPLVQEFLLEFFSTCRIGDEMGLDMAGTLCFQLGGARRSMTCLAHHFGLVSDDGLRGLFVMAHELPLIDMAAEDAPVGDEGVQADPTPIQAPQQPPPPPPAAGRTMP
ncbi:hypothetical protein Tco_0018878, partial [Tanacetum coccineum]